MDKFVKTIKKEFLYYFLYPNSATLSLTERCNLRCRSCGVWKKSSCIKDELDTKTIIRLLRELKDMKIKKIFLIEGEPLLRTDIVEILKEITELGMMSELTTNGTLLRDDLSKRLLSAGLCCAVISIDAPNEVHDSLRGMQGAFKNVIAGTRSLISAKKALANQKTKILINTLITSETVGFIDEWINFACDLQVDGINFLYPTFVPKEVDDAALIMGKKISSGRFVGFDRNLLIKKENIPALLCKLKRIRKEGANRGLMIWIAPDLFLSNPVRSENGVIPFKKCYLTRDSLIINQYGEVMPCSLLDKYSYGTIRNKTIREIWGNSNHRLLLKEIKEGIGMCRYCACHFDNNMTVIQQIQQRFIL